MTAKKEGTWFADGDAYEHYVSRWSRPVSQMFLNWLAPLPGLRWADVGCGTGALTQIILRQSNPGEIVGIEPSEGFLGLAKTAVTDDRAEFGIGDALSLLLENNKVDVVVSGLVLNFVPDKAQAQKAGPRHAASEKVVKDIRRATRKRHSAEEKIRIE